MPGVGGGLIVSGGELDALQDHLVTADQGRLKIAAVATDQSIGTCGRLGLAALAANDDAGLLYHELRIDGDCAGRCYRPRVTQQIGFDPGQGADTELDACYALGALFGGDAL